MEERMGATKKRETADGIYQSKAGGRASTLRRRIIAFLRGEWADPDEGGNVWGGFDSLAESLGASRMAVRREVRRMAKAGRLAPSYAMTRDGKVAGGGYYLTPAWEAHVPGREEDPQPGEGLPEA